MALCRSARAWPPRTSGGSCAARRWSEWSAGRSISEAPAPLTGSVRSGRERRGPEPGDVDAAHEADVFLLQRVVDEIPDCGRTPGVPAPPGVHADRHHPCAAALLQLLEQVVEAELEAF